MSIIIKINMVFHSKFTLYEKYAYALRIPLGDEQEYVKSVLKFPDEYVMPCYIAIGKPADDAVYNKQKEFVIEERVHLNGW